MEIIHLSATDSVPNGMVKRPEPCDPRSLLNAKHFPVQAHRPIPHSNLVYVYVRKEDLAAWEDNPLQSKLFRKCGHQHGGRKRVGTTPKRKRVTPPLLFDQREEKPVVVPVSQPTDLTPHIIKKGGTLTTVKPFSIQLTNPNSPMGEEKKTITIEKELRVCRCHGEGGDWVITAEKIDGKYWGRNARSLELFIQTRPDHHIKVEWPPETANKSHSKT